MPSSNDQVRWVSEAEVIGLMDMPTAIEIVRGAHESYAAGAAGNMPRTHARVDGGLLTAVGGQAEGYAATKTWIHTERGASPVLIVFSTDDGTVRGVIEAFALGEFRTGATSAVATALLARRDATRLALIGAGKQARGQAQGVAAIRRLQEVRVFSPSAQRRNAFVERLRGTIEADVSACGSVGEATDGADIITTVTRAAEPIVEARHIDAGAHLNAVGSYVPHKRELATDAVGRCDVVVTDSFDQARNDSGELRAAVDAGYLAWESVTELGELIRDSDETTREPTAVSLFKALGVGFADAALGSEILRRAREAGAGQKISRNRAGLSGSLPKES